MYWRGYAAVACIVASMMMPGCATPSVTAANDARSGDAEAPLRSAAEACAGVPNAERDGGLFAYPERIVAVDRIRRAASSKSPAQLVGAGVSLRAMPGVTEQWLGRVIVCHEAYAAALPLAARSRAFVGAQFAVASDRVGFRVEITAPDRDRALSVFERARALSGL